MLKQTEGSHAVAEAIARIRASIGIDPASPDAWSNLALALQSVDRAEAALDLERQDIALTRRDIQSVVEHFARLVRCLVAYGCFQQLDALAPRLEPGTGNDLRFQFEMD